MQLLYAVTCVWEKGDFFRLPTSLTVSGQLHARYAPALLVKVYTFDPTFPAGNSNATRQLSELLDGRANEVAFAGLEVH